MRFEIICQFEAFFLCHCSRCRKGTGSAHAANLFSTTAKLTWLVGEELTQTYRVPDTRHQRSFCSVCSPTWPRRRANGTLLVVQAGCLDGDFSMRPTAHICMASRDAWDSELQDLPKLDVMPERKPAPQR